MFHRSRSLLTIVAFLTAFLVPGTVALADHTNPRNRLASTEAAPSGNPTVRGVGTWTHIRNFRANPGTDLEFFANRGITYMSSGTLGQANSEHVGQRIIQLLDKNGNVDVQWVADQGSANCPTANPQGTTGLQHDVQVLRVPKRRPVYLTDTTDALGRCHDPAGGGIEIVDVTGLRKPEFHPREIHLLRFAGFSHNNTVDQLRPWVIYNSSSDFVGRPWIEVVDAGSCMRRRGLTLEEQREQCRPKVFRIPFKPEWSQQRNSSNGQLVAGSEAACHDITSEGNRLYCATPNATIVFDVENLVTPSGKKKKGKLGHVRGDPLDCKIVDGTLTTAKVTDCSSVNTLDPANPGPIAEGWTFVGGFNHPGRDCQPGPGITTNCNYNSEVRSDDGVSVAHEADPSWDGNYVFVTDERGGGVIPGGASCEPGVNNPFGNGGIHVFDIRDPANIKYASKDGGGKAVWIGTPYIPAPTFCTVHVIEKIPDEQRLVVAYYTQGTKIVDYWIDAEGEFHFRETASIIFPAANTWAAEDFKIVNNSDGTRTYYFAASDIQRGIDIFSWTGPTNPIGSAPPRAAKTAPQALAGLLGLAVLALPAAARFRRRRRA
ncbi:MAG: hypothetical protein ACRDHM_02975 [Actinomycetota bacterium]